MTDEEYEVIPTSPIRRLQKRISEMEKTSSSSEVRRLIEQIIELVKSNQRVIDDVVKSNFELRSEMAKIPTKIDNLVDSMSEFMDLLKQSAAEETVSDISKETMKPLVKKLDELIDINKKGLEMGQAEMASLETIDKRIKRLYTQLAAAYGRSR